MRFILDMVLDILQIPQSDCADPAHTGEVTLQKLHFDLFDMGFAELVQSIAKDGMVGVAILAEGSLLLGLSKHEHKVI